MSSPIWTRDALSSEAIVLAGRCWRLVEAQHRVSTLKVVDTLEEQALLEELIEETKAVIPARMQALALSARYPLSLCCGLSQGIAFSARGKNGGRLLCVRGGRHGCRRNGFLSSALLCRVAGHAVAAERSRMYPLLRRNSRPPAAIDLTRPPLDRSQIVWTDLIDYSGCQALADSARQAEIAAIRYQSVPRSRASR